MKPKIAIIYALSRSGATLICKCIGCISGNLLLSEVNPRLAYFNPIVQAAEWFGLFSAQEVQSLAQRDNFLYLDAIRLISDRCRQRNQALIIRDWTHVDFTPGPYTVEPIHQFSQYHVLKQEFEIRPIAITRHPLDSYQSVSRLPEYRGKLTVSTYLSGYRRYAALASAVGYVRYEDFCAAPAAEIQRICRALAVNYDDTFIDRFQSYTTITGESYKAGKKLTLIGETVGARASGEIRLPPRRQVSAEVLQEFQTNADYSASLDLLGYTHEG